jgi:hypothetical protein
MLLTIYYGISYPIGLHFKGQYCRAYLEYEIKNLSDLYLQYLE